MVAEKKISVKQFQSFLQSGYNKKFVKDWLDLAEKDFIPLEDQIIRHDNDNRLYVKFFALFLPFSHIASRFYFTYCERDYEKPTEERISFFIKQLTSQDSDISLAEYNPLKTNNLSVLLIDIDNYSKTETVDGITVITHIPSSIDNCSRVETVESLFRNICKLHKKIFGEAQSVDIEFLDESNKVLKDFLTKIGVIDSVNS